MLIIKTVVGRVGKWANLNLVSREGFVIPSCCCCLVAGVRPRQDPGDTLRMNGVGERERGHIRPALIGPSLRGRERERENDQTGVFAGSGGVWQSLAMLYFLPWLLYPRLAHF